EIRRRGGLRLTREEKVLCDSQYFEAHKRAAPTKGWGRIQRNIGAMLFTYGFFLLTGFANVAEYHITPFDWITNKLTGASLFLIGWLVMASGMRDHDKLTLRASREGKWVGPPLYNFLMSQIRVYGFLCQSMMLSIF